MSAPKRPLEGLKVLVTRAKAQASSLNDQLVALGATPISVAMIEIAPPEDNGAALRAALAGGGYDQIVVASPNGARSLAATVAELGLDGEVLPPVACVGPSTARKLADSPLRVNVVPDRNLAEGLVAALGGPETPGARALLVQAEVSRDVLQVELGAAGWSVDRVVAYRTVDAEVTDDDRVAARQADIVTFTSSSTVERFLRLVGRDALPNAVASIGPITSATARELGVQVTVEADPHTIDGLIDALAAWAAADPLGADPQA